MIRAATPADLSVIAQLIRDLAEYERLSHAVCFDEDKLRENLFGERPYAEVLIAEQGSESIGFALFFYNFSTFLGRPGIYLEDLYVKPAYRGQGHGKALLAALATRAVERDCGRLEWAVLNWNAPSIAFYQSLGALPQDEWSVYRLTGDALRKLAGS